MTFGGENGKVSEIQLTFLLVFRRVENVTQITEQNKQNKYKNVNIQKTRVKVQYKCDSTKYNLYL